MGRRDKYESHIVPHFTEIAELLSGDEKVTEGDVARQFDVGLTSWEKYKTTHDEFRQLIDAAKAKRKKAKIEKYKSLMERLAEGFKYTETKKVIRNVDGVRTQVIEEYEKYSPPNLGALHLLLKNIDENWRNDDQVTIDLKREKIALEKMKAEMNEW